MSNQEIRQYAGKFQKAILLLPGSVDFKAIIMQFSDWLDDSLIIAVDKGIDKACYFTVDAHESADNHQLTQQSQQSQKGVHLWVGDFDSSHDLTVDEALYGAKIPYPVDKDEIDTELALSMARDLGISEVLILGGIGGRIDHQMGLLFLPHQYPELRFIHSNGEQSLYYLRPDHEYEIQTQKGSLISIIALTNLTGLTLMNVKWPLYDFDLALGLGLTYSNRALGEQVSAKIDSGSAWLFTAMPEVDDSL